jgi:hypothetical protein
MVLSASPSLGADFALSWRLYAVADGEESDDLGMVGWFMALKTQKTTLKKIYQLIKK